MRSRRYLRFMSKINITVSPDGDDDSSLKRAKSACEAIGMDVTGTLDSIGILTGEIDAEKLPALKAIPGIAVEEDRKRRYLQK